MAETKKIHDAIIFAAKAHEGQRRKGTDIPYITHPFEVAQILMEAGCDETLIIAGLLHDTLEDTEVTAAEIEEQFGPEVLALVDSDTQRRSADGRRSAPGHGRSLNQNSRSFPRKRRSPWRMPGVISIHP